MRIQNNITAMNTHRMYTINNNAVSKSAEKLSSGYRINRAGDDAAGLAISEKMRSQIRGLNMASKNSQDAVSLIQTAEGALQEVHSMLQRMNELANQAGTGTNETFDRQQIDAEFNQLKEEIDQIAETTSFNNMKLLDGSLASDAAKVSVDASSSLKVGATLTGFTITGQSGLSSQVGSYKIALEGGAGSSKVKITFTDDATGNQTNTIIDLAEAAKDVGAGKAFKLDLSAAGLGIYDVTADTSGTMDAAVLATALVNDEAVKTTSGVGASVTTAATTAGVAGTPSTPGVATMTITAGNVVTGDTIEVDGTTLVFQKAGEELAAGTTGTVINVAAGETDASLAGKVATALSGLATYDVANPGSSNTVTLTQKVAADDDMTSVVTFTQGTESAPKGGLKIQVGANEGEQLEISVASMNTTGLGIDKSVINDQTKAGNAITATQKAINLVSEQRATLGAMQNRLEHKIANLDNTSENLSAAESRIRDVDIAKEMTNFTKNNILSQAATAMLAQANAAPQGVLSLLQ